MEQHNKASEGSLPASGAIDLDTITAGSAAIGSREQTANPTAIETNNGAADNGSTRLPRGPSSFKPFFLPRPLISSQGLRLGHSPAGRQIFSSLRSFIPQSAPPPSESFASSGSSGSSDLLKRNMEWSASPPTAAPPPVSANSFATTTNLPAAAAQSGSDGSDSGGARGTKFSKIEVGNGQGTNATREHELPSSSSSSDNSESDAEEMPKKKSRAEGMNAQEKLALIRECCKHAAAYELNDEMDFWVMIRDLFKERTGYWLSEPRTTVFRWVAYCGEEFVKEEMGSASQTDQDGFKAAVEMFASQLKAVQEGLDDEQVQTNKGKCSNLLEPAQVQSAMDFGLDNELMLEVDAPLPSDAPSSPDTLLPSDALSPSYAPFSPDAPSPYGAPFSPDALSSSDAPYSPDASQSDSSIDLNPPPWFDANNTEREGPSTAAELSNDFLMLAHNFKETDKEWRQTLIWINSQIASNSATTAKTPVAGSSPSGAAIDVSTSSLATTQQIDRDVTDMDTCIAEVHVTIEDCWQEIYRDYIAYRRHVRAALCRILDALDDINATDVRLALLEALGPAED